MFAERFVIRPNLCGFEIERWHFLFVLSFERAVASCTPLVANPGALCIREFQFRPPLPLWTLRAIRRSFLCTRRVRM